MDERGDGDGALSDLPWASVFDPAANARALAEVQRRGLQAAADVVERLVTAVDGEADDTMSSARFTAGIDGNERVQGNGYGPAGSAASTGDLDRLLSTWSSLVQEAVSALVGDGVGRGSDVGSGSRVDLTTGEATGAVRLVAAPGSDARAEVWLHNPGGSEVPGVTLRGGPLMAPDGTVIPAEALRCDPSDLPAFPARSSRGVLVDILVPEGTPPATYRGVLVADGEPDAWLPVDLDVEPPAP